MQNVWNETLQNVRREDMWFKAVTNGTEEDINTMTILLSEDPNHFYCDWDPRKLINCGGFRCVVSRSVDSHNRTALYLACSVCNLRVVRFLLRRNADPRIAFVVDEKMEETPLGCAVRWGYVEVVREAWRRV